MGMHDLGHQNVSARQNDFFISLSFFLGLERGKGILALERTNILMSNPGNRFFDFFARGPSFFNEFLAWFGFLNFWLGLFWLGFN